MSKRTSRRVRAALTKQQGPTPEPEVKNKQLAIINQPPERPILVLKDHVVDYPELYLEVFITEPGAEVPMAEMFARARCTQAKSVETADLVVFTGGPDVNPKLYGEKPHNETRFDDERDRRDMNFYIEALKNRVPMLGICRGAQFLHVMQGGKLIQHIEDKRHIGDHAIVDETKILDRAYIDRVSSTHHQAVIPNNKMEILAYVYRSDARWLNDKVREIGKGKDVEAYLYREACILGVQGHPEYRGYARYTNYCLKLLEEKLVGSVHVTLEGGKYRTKKEVVILDKQ